MTEQEMKLLHERMKKEDPKLLVLMEKCFDAGVLSGKEQAEKERAKQEPWKEFASDYERGVIDGRMMQVQSSVDKAVNAMSQPSKPWVGLTSDEFEDIELSCRSTPFGKIEAMQKVEAKLREKNA